MGRTPVPEAKSTPGVYGGDHCINNTRIPVWMIIDYKQKLSPDSYLLEAFPSLTQEDLDFCKSFYSENKELIDKEKARHYPNGDE